MCAASISGRGSVFDVLRCERFIGVGGLTCLQLCFIAQTPLGRHGARTAPRSSPDADPGHDAATAAGDQAAAVFEHRSGQLIEEELERNPLLERDESAEPPTTDRAAPDQAPERISEDLIQRSSHKRNVPSETAAPHDDDMGDADDPAASRKAHRFRRPTGLRCGGRHLERERGRTTSARTRRCAII